MKPLDHYSRLMISLFSLLLFIILKKDFGMNSNISDGFIDQLNLFTNNSFDNLDYELKYLHFIRFLVVYPFILRMEYNLPYFIDGLILIAFANILSRMRFELIFCVFGLVLSFRSVLCIFGLYYVWQYANGYENSKFVLLMALFLASLSSGVLFNWLLIYSWSLYFKTRPLNSKKFNYLIVILCLLLLSTSVLQKFYFFIHETSVAQKVFINSSYLQKIIVILMRSNLFDLASHHGIIKNLFYAAYYMICIIFYISNYKDLPRSKKYIIGLSLGNFFLEGLPALAYILIYLQCWLSMNLNFYEKKYLQYLRLA